MQASAHVLQLTVSVEPLRVSLTWPSGTTVCRGTTVVGATRMPYRRLAPGVRPPKRNERMFG